MEKLDTMAKSVGVGHCARGCLLAEGDVIGTETPIEGERSFSA